MKHIMCAVICRCVCFFSRVLWGVFFVVFQQGFLGGGGSSFLQVCCVWSIGGSMLCCVCSFFNDAWSTFRCSACVVGGSRCLLLGRGVMSKNPLPLLHCPCRGYLPNALVTIL